MGRRNSRKQKHIQAITATSIDMGLRDSEKEEPIQAISATSIAMGRSYSEEQIQFISGSTSIEDLPKDILINILSRLSVQFIFRCRSVSKTWLNLLLSPWFAQFHLSKSPPVIPLLRDTSNKRLSKALYLVETEEIDDRDDFNMKLNAIFMLPDYDSSSMLKNNKRRGFNVVNSCNGFLCLSGSLKNYPIVICNPINGDYSILPIPEERNWDDIECVFGLGYCPKTKQYKILVVISEKICEEGTYVFRPVAFIYTLGLGMWKRVGVCTNYERRKTRPIFFNGALHWNVDDGDFTTDGIMVFDFEHERFHTIPLPNSSFRNNMFGLGLKLESNSSLGVLKGRINLCYAADNYPIDLLVMEQYGVEQSWYREYESGPDYLEYWEEGLYQPIDFTSNGDLLMYHDRSNMFLSYNMKKLMRFKIREAHSIYEAIAHVPSFVSLKDVVGDDMEVLNVKSRKARTGDVKTKVESLSLVKINPSDRGWWTYKNLY